MAEAQVSDRRCDKCGYVKPVAEVRYAHDVKKFLCNPCWFTTPPKFPGFGRATGTRP